MDLLKKKAIKRAIQALSCLPFNYRFYNEVKSKGLNAEEVLQNKHIFIKRESLRIKTSQSLESAFNWLITVGVLRREVDGQGLTSKVRLTPFGRQILENDGGFINFKPNYLHKIMICFQRKFLIL